MRAAALAPAPAAPTIDQDCPREFEVLGEGHYCLALDALGITFEIDRLRRERSELVGELTVRCEMAGARTVDGVLSVADMNLSSIRARQDRARYLKERAHAPDADWVGLLEELAQRVFTAERRGRPSIDLRSAPFPPADEALQVLGIPLLRRHPVILFGDGGSAKSFLALHFGAELRARHNLRVGLLDWELDAVDHRRRLEAMYGDTAPEIRYLRCDRPLVQMQDAVQRMVRDDRLDYLLLDSIAPGVDTRPDDSDAAARYMQVLRRLNVGALLIAHISKGEDGDKKPFGSAFWHNLARATWNVKPTSTNGDVLTLGLHNRKANTERWLPPRGVQVTFRDRCTTFTRIDPREDPDLARTLPVSARLRAALRTGSLSRQALADELDDVAAGTLQKTLRRELDKGRIVEFPGTDGQPRYGLADTGRTTP